MQVDSNAARNASESTCKADLVMLQEGQDTVVLPGTGAGRGAAGVDGTTSGGHGHLDPRAANPLHGRIAGEDAALILRRLLREFQDKG